MNFIETMKVRRSVRTYLHDAISKSDLDKTTKIIEDTDNPFDAGVRLCVVDNETTDEKLGTYGWMRGAKTFIVGCVVPGEKNIEGFGYAFEKAILNFTV